MIKRFISYYKPHWKLFAVDMFCAVVVAAAGLFYPMVARKIMNEFVPNKMLGSLIAWSFILLGIYLLKAFCNYIVGYYGHIVGIRIQQDMRRDLFNRYEKLPTSYYDDHKTGDLLTRLVNDLFEVSELAHHGPENLFLAVLMLIGSFVVLWGINRKLTLILFAVIPFIVLLTVLSRKAHHTALSNSRKQISVLNSNLENAITGIRETKSYTAEAHEIEKFNADNRKFALYRKDAVFAIGLFESIMTLLTDLLYLVIIAAGGIFYYYGEINVGDLTAFILYISMFLDPIRRFTTLFELLQEGMSGFTRFCEIMDVPVEEDDGKTVLTDMNGDLSFRDVSFHYGDGESPDQKMVISHLNLDVPAGQMLALVGPSGGGKTTLCNLIPRFYNISDGSILLDGTDIRDYTLHSLRQNIGIVSQNVFLFDGTLRENITYGSENATDEEMIEAAKKANIYDYVMTLEHGFDTEVGERGVKLSGGQKQRVAIARVFLKNPKLLILDEATSALDNATEMLIQKSLEELAKGRTVLVVAHRLSTVKHAQKIIVIDRTGIVEQGTHDELIVKNGAYKELYDFQFRDRDTLSTPSVTM